MEGRPLDEPMDRAPDGGKATRRADGGKATRRADAVEQRGRSTRGKPQQRRANSLKGDLRRVVESVSGGKGPATEM